MRIIFCGTSRYAPAFREKITEVLFTLNPSNTTIIHGGCPGVDKMVDAEARKCGFPIEVFPADWKTYGGAAGPIRNKEMLNSGADKVYAFPYSSLEKSVCTKNMVTQARKVGVPVVILQK